MTRKSVCNDSSTAVQFAINLTQSVKHASKLICSRDLVHSGWECESVVAGLKPQHHVLIAFPHTSCGQV